MRGKSFRTLAPFALLVASLAIAQPAPQEFPPEDIWLLIHSELSYLDGVEQRIDLRVDDASPAATLARIGRAARFTIEVEGKLPREPRLTGDFRQTPARDVLLWFAREVDVLYRAERGGKLIVIVRPATDAD